MRVHRSRPGAGSGCPPLSRRHPARAPHSARRRSPRLWSRAAPQESAAPLPTPVSGRAFRRSRTRREGVVFSPAGPVRGAARNKPICVHSRTVRVEDTAVCRRRFNLGHDPLKSTFYLHRSLIWFHVPLHCGQMRPCLLGHPCPLSNDSRQCAQRAFPSRTRSLNVRPFPLAMRFTLIQWESIGRFSAGRICSTLCH